MILDSSGVSSLVPWITATLLPVFVSFIVFASAITCAITLSVPYKVASFKPMTPLILFICLTAGPFTEQAKIFTSGLYFEINLASFPVSVKAIMRLMSF